MRVSALEVTAAPACAGAVERARSRRCLAGTAMKKLLLLLVFAPALAGCLATAAVGVAGDIVGAAVGAAVDVTGAVVGAAIPDGDDDDERHH